MPNRHRIDLLADIRGELKVLKQREEALRSEILADRDNLAGDENEATIHETKVERFDLDLMRQELGLQFLRPFLYEQIVTSIRFKQASKKMRRTK